MEGWTWEQIQKSLYIYVCVPVCISCVCAALINTSITVIQRPGLACHWPTVLDAECWLGNCSITQDFPLESWEPCWIIKLPLVHACMHKRAHTHTHKRFVKLHPVVLANQGPYNCRRRVSDWAGDVDSSEVVCLCVACRPVFVVDLQFYVD